MIGVNIVSGNGLLFDGTKPLPGHMLIYNQLSSIPARGPWNAATEMISVAEGLYSFASGAVVSCYGCTVMQ